MSNLIENKIFDEIALGDSAQLHRTLTAADIQLFAKVSGDVNPTHVDPEFARSSQFRQIVGHSLWGSSLISSILGTEFPGPGSIYVSQNLQFFHPVAVGDTLTVTVTCKEKIEHNHHIVFDCLAINQDGKKVIGGEAEILAPTEKARRPRVVLPEVKISDRETRYRRLLSISAGLAPIPLAVAHPCDAESLRGPIKAAEEGLIVPILVGPENKIRAVAEECGIDLAPYRIVDAPHSHAAAEMAVAMCREGKAEALMKGSLHTDELMSEVVSRNNGIRTDRRISHTFLADIPAYPKPLLLADAAVNIEPTLEDKTHIIRNTIELAHMLGIMEPKVAILAAVETVNPKMRVTIEAAALCKMADRGQIEGGILDGPLAFDNAISVAAAKTKGIRSPVAGSADILIVPSLESGNIVAKQLEYLSDAMMAGVVLGARVPIVLTSRADRADTRSVSCALAQLIAHSKRNGGNILK